MILNPLQRISILFACGALLTAFALRPVPANAAPLEKAECEKLKAEKKSLVVLGVEKNMAKGPEWVKANLEASQLDLIKRYLTVDEQLKFRCHPALQPKKRNATAARIAARKAAAAKARAAEAKAAKGEKSVVKPAHTNAGRRHGRLMPGAGRSAKRNALANRG
jgi:hypothetical protein